MTHVSENGSLKPGRGEGGGGGEGYSFIKAIEVCAVPTGMVFGPF